MNIVIERTCVDVYSLLCRTESALDIALDKAKTARKAFPRNQRAAMVAAGETVCSDIVVKFTRSKHQPRLDLGYFEADGTGGREFVRIGERESSRESYVQLEDLAGFAAPWEVAFILAVEKDMALLHEELMTLARTAGRLRSLGEFLCSVTGSRPGSRQDEAANAART